VKRREFITLIGGAAVAWPLAARAQQTKVPTMGFLSGRSLASDSHLVAAFRQGLKETGYVEGQNVTIEFRWAEGQFDRLRGLATPRHAGSGTTWEWWRYCGHIGGVTPSRPTRHARPCSVPSGSLIAAMKTLAPGLRSLLSPCT
jgi:hypothetical protein